MGERTPHLDPYCRGVFFGLSAMHTTAHLYRAVLEGAGYSLLDAFDIISTIREPIEDMAICGGGAKSAIWRQMISDIYHISITDMSQGAGACLGAAILGGVAGGVYPDVQNASAQVVTKGSQQLSDPDKNAAYLKFAKIYRSLYRSPEGDFQLLSKA